MASRQFKSWSRRKFGRWHQRYYRLFFNLIGAVTFIPPLAIAALAPSLTLYAIPPPWLWLTAAAQLGAVAALLIGVRQTGAAEFLGLSQAMGNQEQSPSFVQSGLYRWVRHPLYSAGLLFIWLTPVMTSNLLALNLGISLYLYVGSLFEERKLLADFGDEYRQYQQQVPRLIPRPWKSRQEID
jgi:protein-S-isoprenylcysteine O-methyltransferase Ste14